MRGMTWILRGLGVAVYKESAWYTEMSPRASFHSLAEENGRVMTWADMDSPRPWVAVYSGNAHEIPRCPHGHRFHPPRLDGRASLESMDLPRLSRGEQGVSVAHGHRHLASLNGNEGKQRIDDERVSRCFLVYL